MCRGTSGGRIVERDVVRALIGFSYCRVGARHFMHNPSHPFRRLFGRLSRDAYNYWKDVSSKQPFVRQAQSALFWLPTITVFTHVGCTIRAVTGNSMQVRIHPIHFICNNDTHARRGSETSPTTPYSTSPTLIHFFTPLYFLAERHLLA